jgi:hypothetical protein
VTVEELSSSLELFASLSEGGEAVSSSAEVAEGSGSSSCSEGRPSAEPEGGNPDGPGKEARRGRGKKGPGAASQVSIDDLRHIPR